MRIAIDVREAAGKRLGKGVYTHGLVSNLLKLDTKNEYLLLTDKPLDFEVGEPTTREVWASQGGPAWHLKTLKKLWGWKPDFFFSPTSFILPSLLPSSIRSIVVVHDLVAFLFPKQHQTKATLMEKFFLPRALKKAARVIVVSENTKRDLLKLFPWISEKPLTVIYPAASERFSQEISKESLEAFRKEKNLPEKFLLAVGALEPRKNLETLLDAYAGLEAYAGLDTCAGLKDPSPQAQDDKLGLVIVGSEGWKNEKLLQQFQQLLATKHKLQTLPYQSEKDLAKLYRLAEAFIFPSLYEGFGIPPLEAMASGCPVICSNAASLPEVCDGAAVLFDPKDKNALAENIKKILTDFSLREMLIQKGRLQAKKFSWEDSAKKLQAVLG